MGIASQIQTLQILYISLPHGSVVKNPPANAGGTGSVSGLPRSPGEGKW